MKDIVQKDTKEGKVLRDTAKEIPLEDISSAKITKLIDEMFDTLREIPDGVALAAPQVGESLRLFIVSPKIFSENPEQAELVYINPVITKKSKDRKLMEEGCLSVRWWYGKIRRSSRATVEAYNQNGDKFEIEGRGLLAQIFQHETDHLNGVLFSDNATELKESAPEQGSTPENES